MLARAAEIFGIEREYTDIWGRDHVTSEKVTLAILGSMGVQADHLERTLEDHALAEWSQPLNRTLVVREDTDAVRLRIPAEHAGRTVKLEIRWENGDLEHHWFWLPELPTLDTTIYRFIR
jgi:hypothetical protein